MEAKCTMDYSKTNTIVYADYADGAWSELKNTKDDHMSLNLMNASLHYGIEAFEGLKAYRGKDGKVRIFRPWDNAKRFRRSCAYLAMAEVPEQMFVDACEKAVTENIDFLPPYGTMASMYIRPFIICTNPQIGLVVGREFMFAVATTPMGSYTGSMMKQTKALVIRKYDRAAPLGSGSYKIGANYASPMRLGMLAGKEGYASILYLDAKTKRYIEEFSSSNFFAIRGDSYITPDSPSVLPSITNRSLRQIAADMGMKVEMRTVPVEELATFDEAAACGTALVITPVCEIDDRDMGNKYGIGSPDKVGEKSVALYHALTGIQFGEREDPYGWCMIL
ncbi:MAG: branched-chain amino acid aminotransferase [Bacteroidales bacterium]|nr:branched-chain amino acid aminotransferase [Bacteroidales bacterium]MCI2144872.1 branched-chain amino acid aminotransferase [Bacteroidales bacterium]